MDRAPKFRGGGDDDAWSGPIERTPALISEALRVLPPPPDRRFALAGAEDDDDKDDPVALALFYRGMYRDNTFSPYADLFLHQKPKNDEHNKAWRSAPLKLHDAGFIAARDSFPLFRWGPEQGLPTAMDSGPDQKGRGIHLYFDFSRVITRVLETHPGPVACLRLDASTFPAPERLRRWVELLTVKQVEELILLNLTGPVDTEAPLHHLRSCRLNRLALGFLNIRDCLVQAMEDAGFDGHPWSYLTDLTLTACTINGPDLSYMVMDLQGLKRLCIGCCALTEGCTIASLALHGVPQAHIWARAGFDTPYLGGGTSAQGGSATDGD